MPAKNFAISKASITKIVETKTPVNDFLIKGTALLNLWGGGQGTIEMTATRFKTKDGKLTLSDIANNLNDGGFGCKSIVKANASVFQLLSVSRVCSETGEDITEDNESAKWVEVWTGEVSPN